MNVKPSSWRSVNGGLFLRKECTQIAPTGDIQKAGNELIMKIARNAGVPLLLTLDAHFVKEEQKVVQDVLLQNGKEMDTGLRFFTKYFQMNTQEAWENWKQIHPEREFDSAFVEAVENNKTVVDLCEQVVLKKEYHLPEVELPIEIKTTEGTYESKIKDYLCELIDRHGRMIDSPIYTERLRTEIKVIEQNGKVNFIPYFIAVHDMCEQARQIGLEVGAGRGSAGGCLLAYLLRITQLDPIVHGLSFERFLSMGRINRGKFPDIDIDFSDPSRLVECLKAKHGDKFVRICTTGTSKIKSAIRDVSRIYLDTQKDAETKKYVDDVCKTINNIPQGFNDLIKWLDGYDDEEGHHAGELEVNPILKDFLDQHQSVDKLVRQVLGVPKSLGRHASAYCLSDIPIHEIVPLCTIKDEQCTQFTMEPIEGSGLIKFDLLGLNTLKDIGNCAKMIKERHGIELDVYDLPFEEQVFKDFWKGGTESVFQFNGPIPTGVCKEVKPSSLIDLASITAACRPGTMYAEFPLSDGSVDTLINVWVKRRKGTLKVEYLHKDLEEILAATHGIVLFQEQISAMFEKSCGYTPEQADEIREIVGKKKKDQMDKIIPDIRNRLHDHGWNESQIGAFISLCRAASSYSFNKSHSVDYAYMGYICAWMKHHYPLEWWTAILQNSSHEDLEKNAKYFSKYVETPDINTSELDFYIIDSDRNKIVYPLSMIKGVKSAANYIVPNRPFDSFEDFFNRVERRKVNLRVVSAMIYAGAFDRMPEAGEGNKAERRNRILRRYKELRGEKTANLEDITLGRIAMLETASLCIGNPDLVTYFKTIANQYDCLTIPEVSRKSEKSRVKTAGVILDFRPHTTKKGEEMCWITLGNGEHQISVTCWPDQYKGWKEFIKKEAVILVTGRTNTYNNRQSVIADTIRFYDLDQIT